MSRIYLSYRRTDAAAYAGRLFDHLSRHFGPGFVFMDIQGSIARGQDFTKAIDTALNTCDVALVIIGKQWATSADPDGKLRLNDPNDWVRAEISAVLRRDILVVPVLVDGARLPEPTSLPEELRPLCRRTACELTDSRWSYDIGEFVKDIDKILRPPSESQIPRPDIEAMLRLVRRAKSACFKIREILPPVKQIKIPNLRINRLYWSVGVITALFALLGIGILGSNVSPVKPSTPGSKTALSGLPAQETRVGGVVAELARFVRIENLITAEVMFNNTGPEAENFCLGPWTLINETTGENGPPRLAGEMSITMSRGRNSPRVVTMSRGQSSNLTPLQPANIPYISEKS